MSAFQIADEASIYAEVDGHAELGKVLFLAQSAKPVTETSIDVIDRVGTRTGGPAGCCRGRQPGCGREVRRQQVHSSLGHRREEKCFGTEE